MQIVSSKILLLIKLTNCSNFIITASYMFHMRHVERKILLNMQLSFLKSHFIFLIFAVIITLQNDFNYIICSLATCPMHNAQSSRIFCTNYINMNSNHRTKVGSSIQYSNKYHSSLFIYA